MVVPPHSSSGAQTAGHLRNPYGFLSLLLAQIRTGDAKTVGAQHERYPHTAQQVAVAEAIRQADADLWDGEAHFNMATARVYAQAAIDALQLTVETSQIRESYGYYAYPTRSRLVGPWVEGSTEQ